MDGTMDSTGIEEEEKDDIRFWKYIKEGNSSYVIGHKKKHIVYRMWKRDAKDVLEENSRKRECWAKINYIKNCFQPTLGRYASIPKCVSVSPDFVDSVSKAFESQRPLKRCHQILDPYQTSVLCSPNFCFLEDVGKTRKPTLTVELKPKLGYIPTRHQSSLGTEDHEPICMFCMQQTLKRKKGAWDYTSKYCPVKLFSGDADQMRHALESLFETPQNNLCIFRDGELIYPGEGKSLPTQDDHEDITMAIQSWFGCEEGSTCNNTHLPLAFTKSVCIQDLISLVIQALCKSDSASTHTFQEIGVGSSPWIPCLEGQSHGLNHKEEVSECKLPKGCVLERMITMQRVDTHGINVIHRVYQKYMDHLNQYPEEKEGLGITNSCSTPFPTTNLKRRLSDDEVSSLPIQDCVTLLKGYMMSRTARDCSILITFKPADLSSTTSDDMVSLKEERFHFACHLVDLDSKSPTKIPHYHKLEHLISETYQTR